MYKEYIRTTSMIIPLCHRKWNESPPEEKIQDEKLQEEKQGV